LPLKLPQNHACAAAASPAHANKTRTDATPIADVPRRTQHDPCLIDCSILKQK
jgi:hypothetical protein